jgi:hypothetical protein
MAVRLSASLYPQEDSWYSFLLEADSTQPHTAAGRIRLIEKSNGLIRNLTCDLLAFSIAHQPTTQQYSTKQNY